ncbi:MAG: hypothetical protein CMH70_01525 [Nitrosomonadaceae bacterium]|nr:hypothetical protein [Nitrosomonadaceae bacterium]|tara:strand:+ start:256 stop:903 length:648 start_codon:yes stop_codon:yes gene_type:complete
MLEVILLVIGVVAGFCLYKKIIMSASKQNSINNKILSAISDKSDQDSSALALRIREDVNNSYQLEWQDIKTCFIGYFCSDGASNKASGQETSSKEEYKDDEIESFLKSKFDCLKDWDIRSLSKKQTSPIEEPLAENTENKEEPIEAKEVKLEPQSDGTAPLSSERESKKEAKAATENKAKKEPENTAESTSKNESSSASKTQKGNTSSKNNSKNK